MFRVVLLGMILTVRLPVKRVRAYHALVLDVLQPLNSLQLTSISHADPRRPPPSLSHQYSSAYAAGRGRVFFILNAARGF